MFFAFEEQLHLYIYQVCHTKNALIDEKKTTENLLFCKDIHLQNWTNPCEPNPCRAGICELVSKLTFSCHCIPVSWQVSIRELFFCDWYENSMFMVYYVKNWIILKNHVKVIHATIRDCVRRCRRKIVRYLLHRMMILCVSVHQDMQENFVKRILAIVLV